VVLGGCLITHLDNEIGKHIKEIIRRVVRKPPDNQEQSRKPDTINQIVRTLRRGPEYPYDLMFPTHSSWPDDGSKT
jgi:hypothetical protein